MISVVISVLNEERDLEPTIQSLDRAVNSLKLVREIEVIIVNDGSTDNTQAIINKKKKIYPYIRSIQFEINQGLGAAFLAAAKVAKFERITIIPGDNAYSEKYLQTIIENAEAADVVFSHMTNPQARTFFRRIISGLYNWIYRTTFNLPISYVHGTPIYKTKLILSMKLSGTRYAIFSELAVKTLFKGETFLEINGEYEALIRKSSALKLKVLVDVISTYLKLVAEIYFFNREEYHKISTSKPKTRAIT